MTLERDDVVGQQGAVWARDSRGQRKLEDWRRVTSSSGRTQPRIE